MRGDCGYGNEDIIDVCEQRGKSYLLRLRKTANLKRLIERLFTRDDWTRATEASQGWQAIEDSLKLIGWSRARRVVVLRRRAIGAPPAYAANAPSAARKTSETVAMTGITSRVASMPASNGTPPPSAKLTDDVTAACIGRADSTSEMPMSSRACAPRASWAMSWCDTWVASA